MIVVIKARIVDRTTTIRRTMAVASRMLLFAVVAATARTIKITAAVQESQYHLW